MSLLSEIVIEPKKSKIYLRLILVLSLGTFVLIFYSSIYLWIKLILIGFVVSLLGSAWRTKSACAAIKKIQFIANQWILEHSGGTTEQYDQCTVLISNPLFQLIQLSNPSRKKLIVLFHDQVTSSQLRLMYLNLLILNATVRAIDNSSPQPVSRGLFWDPKECHVETKR